VPFVSNELLQQLIAETSALKVRLAAYQDAVERLAQTTTSAAAGHLNDTREVVRRALTEQRDANAAAVIAIRDDIHRLDRPAPAATPEAAQAPQAAPEAAGEHAGHVKLLKAAAGISAATFRVHRDTWAFLVEHAGQDHHFHIPGDVTADGGTLTVDVSGRSLVAALTSLQAVHQATGVDPGTRAIAQHLYDRIEQTVNAVAATPHTGDGAEPVTITVDDRIGASPATEAPTAEPEATNNDGPADDGPDSHLGD
jgi:hypothetical protein